jgi:hypothetical protein
MKNEIGALQELVELSVSNNKIAKLPPTINHREHEELKRA